MDLELETDPHACEWSDNEGNESDKLDNIFSSSFKKDVVSNTKLTPLAMRRKKKQNQKETKKRLQDEREAERLKRLDITGPKPIISNSKGQRKVDRIKTQVTNTKKKYLEQLNQHEFEPVYNDRRLYGADSFIDDKVIPVKVITKEEVTSDSDFDIKGHHMMRNHTDGSAFLYGKTQFKQFAYIETKSRKKISKKQDELLRKKIALSNFSFDVQGAPAPVLYRNKMSSTNENDKTVAIVLQQDAPVSSTNEQQEKIEISEEILQQQVSKQREMNSLKKQNYLSTPLPSAASSKIEKFEGSPDPHKGFETIDQEIDQRLQSQEFNKEMDSKQENVPILAVPLQETSRIEEQLKALTAQVASLIAMVAEKDNTIAKLLTLIEELKEDKQAEADQKEIKEIVQRKSAETAKELRARYAAEKAQNEFEQTLNRRTRRAIKFNNPGLPRSNTSPLITTFKDDGINKQLDVQMASTSKQQKEVIKNNLQLSPEDKSKVVNQGVRPVNAESVGSTSFAAKLLDKLVRSKSTVSYAQHTPKVELPPRPKGIQAQTWALIVKSTPIGSENWEAKRKVKVFEQYKKLYFAQRATLEVKWQEAVVKVNQPKLKNTWLLHPTTVITAFREGKLEEVPNMLKQWRDSAATYVPKIADFPKEWAKAIPKPVKS
jgi:hypothetical protein